MNQESILTCAIIGHLVGDYLLQNDYLALNKKKTSFPAAADDWQHPIWEFVKFFLRWLSFPCFIHCFIWTVCVMAFAGWHGNNDGWKWVWVFGILFSTHYLQDRTQIIRFWMTRINRQPKFVEPPMAPWSIIVVDNVWHILTIWIVWRFIA